MYHRNLRQDISFRMNIKNRRYINLFFDHAGRFNNKKIIIYVEHSCVRKDDCRPYEKYSYDRYTKKCCCFRRNKSIFLVLVKL